MTTASNEDVLRARRVVRQRLGRAVEAKSTDDYCLAILRESASPRAAALEVMAAGRRPHVATIIEFSPPATFVSLGEAVQASGSRRDSAEVLASGMPGAPVVATAAFRQKLIQDRRAASYAAIGPLYSEIERQSGGIFRPSPLDSDPLSRQTNQICWLNGTLRTQAPPEVLADLASAESVNALDVPVRILPEADPVNLTTIRHPPFVQRTGLSGKGVAVGVIDSEVSIKHPALTGRVVQRRNYTAEPWGSAGEHGTAVAGIIGAQDEQHPGVAPDVTLYTYKVLATNSLLNGDDFDGVLAIQQALEDGVDVVNCSWGVGPAGDGTGRDARAVDAAWDLGLVIVKSAGNNGPGPRTMTSPADARGVIVVGATDLSGSRIADYSSRGPAGKRTGPDLVAPGGELDGAVIAGALVGGGFGGVGVGTSFAAPHVTGLACAYLERAPSSVPEEMRSLLARDARPLPGVSDEDQGLGLLQCE